MQKTSNLKITLMTICLYLITINVNANEEKMFFSETDVMYTEENNIIEALVDLWPHKNHLDSIEKDKVNSFIINNLINFLENDMESDLEKITLVTVQFVFIDDLDEYARPNYANMKKLGTIEIIVKDNHLVICETSDNNTFSYI